MTAFDQVKAGPRLHRLLLRGYTHAAVESPAGQIPKNSAY